MNTITRKPLASVLDIGGAITISPDGVVNYLDEKNATSAVLEVLEHADYTVLRHGLLDEMAERSFPNDVAGLAGHLNEFFGLEEVR